MPPKSGDYTPGHQTRVKISTEFLYPSLVFYVVVHLGRIMMRPWYPNLSRPTRNGQPNPSNQVHILHTQLERIEQRELRPAISTQSHLRSPLRGNPWQATSDRVAHVQWRTPSQNLKHTIYPVGTVASLRQRNSQFPALRSPWAYSLYR